MAQIESEKEELKEKLKKGCIFDDIGRLLEYCKNNIDLMDMQDETDAKLYYAVVIYLTRYKMGKIDKKEALLLTKYYSRFCINIYLRNGQLMQNINVEILKQAEYEAIQGEDSYAVCIDKDNQIQTVLYSEKLIEKLMSNKTSEVFYAFQLLGHEIVHGVQNSIIRHGETGRITMNSIKTGYLMALENLTKKAFPDFYKRNYENLIKENNANADGIFLASEFLRIYSPNIYQLFDPKKIQSTIDKYRRKSENSERIIGDITFSGDDVYVAMESIAKELIQNNLSILQHYKILKVAYHEDGTRKSITELLSDRERYILADKNSTNGANDLFLTILNSRYDSYDDIVGQLDEIETYDWKRESDLEFAYDVLRNRLRKLGLSQEEIEEYIKDLNDENHEVEEK